MSMWILKHNGEILSRSILHTLADSEIASETERTKRVAEGNTTNLTAESTYAGVVSLESVQIAFTLSALNDLDIFAADIQNAYLNAPCGENIIFTCGAEFGSDHKSKTTVIVQSLYGLRSSESAFHNNFVSCMEALNYLPRRADTDVWMQKSRKSNGTEYYEYMLLYVDDCLAISKNPNQCYN